MDENKTIDDSLKNDHHSADQVTTRMMGIITMDENKTIDDSLKNVKNRGEQSQNQVWQLPVLQKSAMGST